MIGQTARVALGSASGGWSSRLACRPPSSSWGVEGVWRRSEKDSDNLLLKIFQAFWPPLITQPVLFDARSLQGAHTPLQNHVWAFTRPLSTPFPRTVRAHLLKPIP